jgi:hypothetical protein
MSAAQLPSDLPNVRDGYRRLLDVLTAKAADYAAEVNKLANSAELSAERRVLQYKYALLCGQFLLNVHSNCALFAKRGKRDGAMAELPAEFRAAHRAVYDMLVGLSRIPKICKLAKVNEQIGALVVAAAAAAAAPPAPVVVGGRRRAARKARGGDDSACATGAPMDYAAAKSSLDAARAAIGLAAAKGAAEADAAILAELAGADAAPAAAAPVAAAAPAAAGGAKRRSARRSGAKGV